MKAPIIINDSFNREVAADVAVYDSVEKAEASLELNDAEDPPLHVFDSNGMLLGVRIDERRRARLFAPVEPEFDLNALVSILKQTLIRVGHLPSVIDRMEHHELIQAVYQRWPNPYA